MKIFIASDIHGSAYYCQKLIDAFKKEEADRIILLGDILYHGPRNDLPKDYNPKAVIELLNEFSDRIISVRGNCDSEVDQMVLKFPIMADYCLIPLENRTVFATHGHLYGPDNLPSIKKGDILLCGHTHVTKYENRGEYYYFNPGSVSIPKENTANGYMTLDNGEFVWKTLDGAFINSVNL